MKLELAVPPGRADGRKDRAERAAGARICLGRGHSDRDLAKSEQVDRERPVVVRQGEFLGTALTLHMLTGRLRAEFQRPFEQNLEVFAPAVLWSTTV